MTCSAPMAITTEAQPMRARATAVAHWFARTAASGTWRVRHLGDMAVPTRCIQACGLESRTTLTGLCRRVVCSQLFPLPLQLLPRLLRLLLPPLAHGRSFQEMVARRMATALRARTIRRVMATTRHAPSPHGMLLLQSRHSIPRAATIPCPWAVHDTLDPAALPVKPFLERLDGARITPSSGRAAGCARLEGRGSDALDESQRNQPTRIFVRSIGSGRFSVPFTNFLESGSAS